MDFQDEERSTNKLRLPVVGLVEELVTSRSLSISGILVALGEVKVGATGNDVDMSRDLSWRDDRITTLDSQRRTVNCKELSVGALKNGCSCSHSDDR